MPTPESEAVPFSLQISADPGKLGTYFSRKIYFIHSNFENVDNGPSTTYVPKPSTFRIEVFLQQDDARMSVLQILI